MTENRHHCKTTRPDCTGCPGAGGGNETGPDVGTLAGWRLAAVSIGLFLGPILLALIGAACFSARAESQLLGAIAGLLIGIGGSVAVARLVRQFEPRTS
ncbi:MAG: hypothetical protein HQ567_03010 [Candidatus Nealsonbacteria bacterium]|nr:hypothetical protein [Candidatus Nealsonbacteria bacterium]